MSDDIMDDVRLAIKQVEEGDEAAKEPDTDTEAKAPEEVEAQTVEGGEEAAKEVATETPETPATPAIEAPQSWGAAVKEKWAALPIEVQQQIAKREQDIHQAMTRHDGELNLGRAMKETIAPYMATFQAEGVSPQQAITNILNNDHILRHGTPQQKVQKAAEILQYYGIPPEVLAGAEISQPQPTDYIMQELAQLKQQLNPQALMQQLQQQQEDVAFQKEIEAFASDPANVYFNQLRETVAALVGQGKTLKEAYDMACYADPSIRSTLLAKQKAEEEAKRKADVAAKKRAAASITGSPATPSNSGSQQTSKYTDPADDLRQAFAEHRQRI